MVTTLVLLINLILPFHSSATENKIEAWNEIPKGRAFSLAKKVAAHENAQQSRALWLSKYLINKRKNIALTLKPTSKAKQKNTE